MLRRPTDLPRRARPIQALAIVVIASVLGGSVAAEEIEIHALLWLRPGADRVASLTTRPTECSVAPGDADRARRVELGRIAFRSPVLLGGLASRLELRCDSCHQNGRDHPDFFFPEVSGAPGTVDVSANVFSHGRDDGVFNPVSIPDLVGSAANPPFGTVVPSADLPTFLRAVVEDEFEGEVPPASVAKGLIDYLESLREEGCPSESIEAASFERDARELDDIASTLEWAWGRGDRDGSEFVLLSWRAALGRLHRRFPESISEREEIVAFSRGLGRIRPLLAEGSESAAATGALRAARRRQAEWLRALEPRAKESFYSASTIAAALGIED